MLYFGDSDNSCYCEFGDSPYLAVGDSDSKRLGLLPVNTRGFGLEYLL